jgi:hypothetical protein
MGEGTVPVLVGGGHYQKRKRIKMKERIRQILREERQKKETQYQVRDIGGPIYYKKVKGEKYWHIIDEKEYFENSNKKNRIEWVDKSKKNKSSDKVIKRTLEITKSQMEMLDKKGECDCGDVIIKLKK